MVARIRIQIRVKRERDRERERVDKAINFQCQVPFALLTLVTVFPSITQGGGLQHPPLPKWLLQPLSSLSPSLCLTLTFRLSVNLITLVGVALFMGHFSGMP